MSDDKYPKLRNQSTHSLRYVGLRSAPYIKPALFNGDLLLLPSNGYHGNAALFEPVGQEFTNAKTLFVTMTISDFGNQLKMSKNVP